MEDILKQPFYTVVHEERPKAEEQGGRIGGLRDYRTLLTEMLLSLRILSPPELSGRSLGEHLSSGLDWRENRTLGRTVGRAMRTGEHNSLCLAHGRRPILPVGTQKKIAKACFFFAKTWLH